MKITFVLPSRIVAGGTRVLFEFCKELKRRDYECEIVFPLFPFSVENKVIFNSKLIGNFVKEVIRLLVRLEKFDWYDRRFLRPIVSLNNNLFSKKVFDASDFIIATTWDSAYAVNSLKQNSNKKFYFVQSYELWDIWNDTLYWDRLDGIRNADNELYYVLPDLIPNSRKLVIKKQLIDGSFKLPLRKITIARWLKHLIENKFCENVEDVITNGVDFSKFYVEKIKHNQIRVLMPFRNIPLKGISDGFKAFEIVRKTCPNVDFVVYGMNYHSSIPKWVKFEKGYPDSKLRSLYCSADIFILPSWIEGCQLPPMEAMACGCSVIATDVGGVRDYCIENKTVLLTPPRQPEKLAKKILYLIQNKNVREAMSENALKYISQFSWKRAVDKLESLLIKC
jgi:glycosyltransferase involved in cell wall biosynthesis